MLLLLRENIRLDQHRPCAHRYTYLSRSSTGALDGEQGRSDAAGHADLRVDVLHVMLRGTA